MGRECRRGRCVNDAGEGLSVGSGARRKARIVAFSYCLTAACSDSVRTKKNPARGRVCRKDENDQRGWADLRPGETVPDGTSSHARRLMRSTTRLRACAASAARLPIALVRLVKSRQREDRATTGSCTNPDQLDAERPHAPSASRHGYARRAVHEVAADNCTLPLSIASDISLPNANVSRPCSSSAICVC